MVPVVVVAIPPTDVVLLAFHVHVLPLVNFVYKLAYVVPGVVGNGVPHALSNSIIDPIIKENNPVL